MSTAYNAKTVDHYRGRLAEIRKRLDWLRKDRRSDWQSIRRAEIDAGLALGRLADAERKN